MASSLSLPIREKSHVADARRRTAELGTDMDDTTAGAVALVVTELSTNLLKHAHGGELLVRQRDDGIEILALDHGPGIGDIERSLADGYSTAGSSGTGLGAVRRMSATFDIQSTVGVGTAVLAYVRPQKRTENADTRGVVWEIGGVSVARHGRRLRRRLGDRGERRPVDGDGGRRPRPRDRRVHRRTRGRRHVPQGLRPV